MKNLTPVTVSVLLVVAVSLILTPVSALAQDATESPETLRGVVTAEALNVRKGPGADYSAIGVVYKDDVLSITGRNEDESWLCITKDDLAGWVSAKYVNISGDVTTLPVTTPTPAPEASSTRVVPTATPSPKYVAEFRNLHYECQGGRLWHYNDELGDFSGYRSFQVDFFMKNLSNAPLTPYWGVTRWVITDGVRQRTDTKVWEWLSREGSLYKQPVIEPGAAAGWTFLAYPLQKGEWVKAAQAEWKSGTYLQQFDLGEFGDAHNYVNCG